MSNYHLICVQPFGKYVKGQMITDAEEVETLLPDREHHFVRITAPSVEPAPEIIRGKQDKLL